MGFRLCPDFFTLSRSMFFRAIKAVISRQPEPLYFSDFFILRFITSVLIFKKLLSCMTVLSCQRSYTLKVLSPYCLRRLHFIEMRRSSCSWWGVSALCDHRRLGAAQFYRNCEQIHSAIAPSTDWSVKIMAHIRTGSHTRFVIRGSYSVFNEPAPTEGLNYYLCRR